MLRYVDLMAAHKLNVLHLHLTDDQGWRVEITRYPRLTEVGAWRERTKVGLRESPLWDERPHGGYYTHDDIREIVAYAARAAHHRRPRDRHPRPLAGRHRRLPRTGQRRRGRHRRAGGLTSWGVNPNVLAPTDETLRFYESVLTEILDLFPSPFVHIGGDECPKEQWRRVAGRAGADRELGLADEDELQSWFIGHFDRWLADRGRRLIGWDEILEGGLAPGAAVSSWRGYAGGIAAAQAGHDVVMCPQTARLPGPPPGGARRRAGADRARPHAGGRLPLRAGTAAARRDARRAHVLGAQANIWTEMTDSTRALDYLVFPRLTAFAEVAWSPLPAPADRDWRGFTARMARALRAA